MIKKSYVRYNYDYPIDDNPVSDGKVVIHKPRRIYLGIYMNKIHIMKMQQNM